MRKEAKEAERQGTQVAGMLNGKKAAILKEARSTKAKAAKMMSTYLDRNADALDVFEFMTMAEAGEVGHWAVLGELNKKARHPGISSLVRTQLPIQKRHLKEAQQGALEIAADEDPGPMAAPRATAPRRANARTATRKATRKPTSKATTARRTTAKATTARRTTAKATARRQTPKKASR
jgi:hypothetical protein